MPITLKGTGEVDAFIQQSGAKTPCKVYEKTSGGKRLIYAPVEIIDDFEDGNRTGWNVPSSTGSDTVTTSGLDGTSYRWEQTGFREAHLAGVDAVDRGPQPGDVFEFWFRVESTSGSTINRFEFSADGINENDVYRIEFERETGDNEFQIQKISGGSSVKNDTDPGHSVAINQTYRCEIQWNAGNNNITAQLFLPDGTADSNQVSITDDSSAAGSDFTQPGIFIRTNGNNVCSWDEIRIPNT